MIPFLKLIRIQNLLIVAATQYLMRYAIISPILGVYKFELQLSNLLFFLLVFATVCLTAAGYVINDYFDTKTDSLNRPKEVIVGRNISRRSAMALHIALNIIGVLCGFYVSYKIGHLKFGFIFILVTGILWYYSTTYKRQFLIGNLIVSLLTALVPLMVILYELPILNRIYSDVLIANESDLFILVYWVAAFAYFAFITTLIREMIKDIEDFEGDSAYGRNTLPIALGVFYTKIIISFLILVTLVSLLGIYIKFLQNSQLTLWYLIITQFIPMVGLIVQLMISKNKKDYHFASLLIKFIMLFGVLYSLIAAYIFLYTF